MAAVPTAAEVRAWLETPATVIDDVQLGHVLDAEIALQAAWCTIPEVYPDALYQAVLRRCGRQCAARGVPLGIVGADAEFGTSVLRRWDGEIERLEMPYLTQVLA